jgi:hypothetical protein
MSRNTTLKLAIAALIAGAVAGGVGVGRAQVVSTSTTVPSTTTTISSGSVAPASAVNPTQTG